MALIVLIFASHVVQPRRSYFRVRQKTTSPGNRREIAWFPDGFLAWLARLNLLSNDFLELWLVRYGNFGYPVGIGDESVERMEWI
jgi:hypothetical protein